jgi:uncharacterized protein YjbJ (UPF0337 family)
MNWDKLEGQWKSVSATLKSKWAKLTDDDVKNLGAKKDALVAKLQERYGILKDEAEREVDEWIAKLSPHTETQSGSDSPLKKDGSKLHPKSL